MMTPEQEEIYKTYFQRCMVALQSARDLVTEEALKDGQLPAAAICVGVFMACIDIAALALVAGGLNPDDFDGELRRAIEDKRAKLEAKRKRELQ